MSLTQADVDALIAHGGRVTDAVRWKHIAKTVYKFEVWVGDTYEGARVKVTGSYNARVSNLSYALIWNSERVRGWDIGGPAHAGVPTPHRHYWGGNPAALQVEPLAVPHDSLENVLRAFLAECNITLEGDFIPAAQQGLLL